MAKKESPQIAALKELGRVVCIAVIPVLILQLENGKIDLSALFVVGSIAVLRAIDKYLHKADKKIQIPF